MVYDNRSACACVGNYSATNDGLLGGMTIIVPHRADIGWQVSPSPVPVPGALVLLFSGLSVMVAWGKRRALV